MAKKTKSQIGVDAVLQEAKLFSDGDPTMAITILMGAAIYLQQQIKLPKKIFLQGASLQWDDIDTFLEAVGENR